MIALTSDPLKYGFNYMKDDEGLLDAYKDVSNEYFEKLKDFIENDLNHETFRHLGEMIQNCPEKMI